MPIRPPLHRPPGAYDKSEADKRRGNSAERGYDALWRRCRSLFLRAHPRCLFHLERGLSVKATVVDHIKSIAERPDLRLDWSNLRSLCEKCHNARTARDQGFGRKTPPRAPPNSELPPLGG